MTSTIVDDQTLQNCLLREVRECPVFHSANGRNGSLAVLRDSLLAAPKWLFSAPSVEISYEALTSPAQPITVCLASPVLS